MPIQKNQPPPDSNSSRNISARRSSDRCQQARDRYNPQTYIWIRGFLVVDRTEMGLCPPRPRTGLSWAAGPTPGRNTSIGRRYRVVVKIDVAVSFRPQSDMA
jgi:hypothetical protein